MGFHESLTPPLVEFIRAQHVFFIATAANGRINLSPKGMNTFRVLDAARVGYLDLTGSGNETSAHLLHDGRATIMFCSFGTKPSILRLYGHGEVTRPGDAEWDALLAHFDPMPGQRQIISVRVENVHTSCGFAVPMMDFKREREQLIEWAAKKGEADIARYREQNNRVSIDGLTTHLGSEGAAGPSA